MPKDIDISKLINPNKVTPELLRAMQEDHADLAKDIEDRRNSTFCKRKLKEFVTQHPRMLELKKHINILSDVSYPVLIQGETGTGKELLAQALHGERKGPFIPINCAGIPETLLEAELFGALKGAYTGAVEARKGILKAAENGTVFLDEIGDMPLAMQAKILRAIQEKKIIPLAGTQEQEINCRFICATHRDLKEWSKQGLFREDLYWRISTFIIEPTPLRDRMNDVPLIIKHLDKEGYIKNYDDFCKIIDKDMLTGNVRTLQQIVLRYCVLNLLPNDTL